MKIKFFKIIVLIIAILFSKQAFAKEAMCPEGYICLPKNDPLILASTSPCFISSSITTSFKDLDSKAKSIGDSISFKLLNKNKDYAGTWGVFKSGSGSSPDYNKDWGFVLSLNLSKLKTIKSITIINDDGNEGWSTSANEKLFGKKPYPLVAIDKHGEQLNYEYDDTISIPKGESILNIYGQIEYSDLRNTEIVVIFTDNTYLNSRISENASTQANNSLWAKLKSKFGF